VNTQTRNLHAQIIALVTDTEGQPETNDEAWVMQVTSITPEVKGMKAIQGTKVKEGQRDITTRSGVYLAKTFHRRGDKQAAIYNVCVMDRAGDIRLLIDTRTDSRTPGAAYHLRTSLTKLIAQHHELNYHKLPYRHPIILALNEAANLIKDLSPDEQAAWMTYLLEALTNTPDQHTNTNFLKSMEHTIETRLLTGLW